MTLYKNRKRFDSVSFAVGKTLSGIGLSPNKWTLLSLIPVIISAYFLVKEQFIIAAVFFIIAGFMDMVDGAVARYTSKTTKLGSYLDTVVDRYVEGLIVFALLFSSLPNFYLPIHAWLVIYLYGALTTTYFKSAAKEKGIFSEELRGGLLERAERLILLFIGILLAALNPLYLTYIIVILAVLSNVSALQRASIAVGRARVKTTIRIRRN